MIKKCDRGRNNAMKLNLSTIIIILSMFAWVHSSISTEVKRHIVFEIDSEYVSPDRKPTKYWQSKLSPWRDSKGNRTDIEAIRIPEKATFNPNLNCIFRLTPRGDENISECLESILKTEGVIWAELSPIRYTCGIPGQGAENRIDSPPNDPFYPLQWYLHKISSIPAWDVAIGDSNVTIAIVDIGVNLDHNDLQRNRWVNYPEKNGEPGVDDDGNGFVDDLHGWDFYDDDSDPRPGGTDSHGTHVAGLTAAVTDNGFGISGVSWNCRYMSIRVGSVRRIAFGYEGVIYAAASGADIINLSWGSNSPSNIERITIDYATEQGALVIAAAGNENVTPPPFNHYPAAYENVLAVAAVDTSDKLARLSNYNSWVDISAPGVDILSTISNGYGMLSGTSMATPIVAGAAALLKSKNPNWTNEQLKLQLMLSSDPIDNLNPSYADSIGYGRLNIYRALADQQSGFEITDFTVSDGQFSNHNGIIERDEDVEVIVELKNLLSKSALISGWISSDDQYLDIDSIVVDFGVIEPDASSTNSQMPFIAHIHRLARQGRVVKCHLNLIVDGTQGQSIPFSLTIQPPYVNHNNGNILLTVTNFGAFGYFDYPENRSIGEGMRFPKGGLNGMFHGSLMISTSPGNVSDCAFGDSLGNSLQNRFDFESTSNEFHIETSDNNEQTSTSNFNDPLKHIEIEQTVISYPDSPDDDYVLVEYTIKNVGLFELDSVQVALFLDWDIVNTSNNKCKWDEEAQFGWMEHTGGGFPVFGAALLDQTTGFQVAVNNSYDWPSGRWERWSDRAKYDLMQMGFRRSKSEENGDYSQLIGTKSFSIGVQRSIVVTFAILAGENSTDLEQNLNAAVEKMESNPFLRRDDRSSPVEFELISVYPQPFNGNVNVFFRLPEAGTVNWDIFNLTGRRIKSGSLFYPSAGDYSTPIEMDLFPSGLYLVRFGYGGNHLTKRLTLLR